MTSTLSPFISTDENEDILNPVSPGGYWIQAVMTTIAVIGLTVLLFNQSFKQYQDMYTEDRKSVSYRRVPPIINDSYKLVSYLTLSCMMFSLVYAISTLIGSVFVNNLSQCRSAIFVNSSNSYSRFCIYGAFSVRLHMVYHGSQFEISPKLLIGLTGFSFVYLVGIVTFAAIMGPILDDSEYLVTYEVDDNGIGNCWFTVPAWYLAIRAFFDLLTNIVYGILFVKPIRAVIKSVHGSDTIAKQSKLSRQMLAMGLKVTILSAVLMLSTILTFVLYGVFAINFGPTDAFINSICLALMTPYYPDKKFYQKLCKCCILCCDRKGYTIKKDAGMVKTVSSGSTSPDSVGDANRSVSPIDHESTLEGNSSTWGAVSSVDTASAVRIGATNSSPQSINKNQDEAQLAESLKQNQS